MAPVQALVRGEKPYILQLRNISVPTSLWPAGSVQLKTAVQITGWLSLPAPPVLDWQVSMALFSSLQSAAAVAEPFQQLGLRGLCWLVPKLGLGSWVQGASGVIELTPNTSMQIRES